jgi:glycosyltransferase involved in cell wall biosynthesis
MPQTTSDRSVQEATRVSVIIPVFNRQKLGERALRSAVAQELNGMEIVVFDDCSTPPFEIPADLKGRADISLLRSEHNEGESASRNAAVAAARGSWLAFLDSDDYWVAGSLQPRLGAAELAYSARKDPLTVHVAGFEIDHKLRGYREVRIPVGSDDTLMFASGCWFCPGSTSLLRKEAFNIVGPCDVALRRLQDMDWYLRLALAGGRIDVWNDVVAVVERGPKVSITSFEIAVEHLRSKYASLSSPHRLSPLHLRRMEAYFDIERASIFYAQRNWIRMFYVMARSLAREPRLTLHLERFWHHVAKRSSQSSPTVPRLLQ